MTSIGLGEHLVAVLSRMPSASASVVSAPGLNPQDEAAFRQVIEHRGLNGDQHGVHVGEVSRCRSRA